MSTKFKETDSYDGKSKFRQLGLALFYLLGSFVLYWLISRAMLWMIQYAFGDWTALKFRLWLMLPLSTILTFMVLARSHHTFWLCPGGNRIIPTTNVLWNKILEGGGTRYIVYGTGVALKWPWEVKDDEIQIEREGIHSCGPFTTNVEGTSLEMGLSVSWRTHPYNLSAWMQNGRDEETLKKTLDQIAHNAQQHIEELVAEYKNPDDVRTTLTKLALAVTTLVQPIAARWGIEIANISFSKCDYDKETQQRLNKKFQTKIVTDIYNELIAGGMESIKASEMSAILAGVEGVERKRFVLEVEGNAEIARALSSLSPMLAQQLSKSTAGKNPSPKGKTP